MGLKENFIEAIESVKWKEPRSVGTARVSYVQKPHHDMVFLDLGDPANDLTASEFVFTPPDLFRKGDVVEVFVREARFQPVVDYRLGLPSKCKVAIRQFKPGTLGKILPQDKVILSKMFENAQNIKDPLSSRAFYRKFMGANLGSITKSDILGPGKHL